MLDVSVAYWDSFLANQGQTMSNPPKADIGRAHFAPVHGVEAPGNVSKLLEEDQVWGAIAIPCSWRKDPAAIFFGKKEESAQLNSKAGDGPRGQGAHLSEL